MLPVLVEQLSQEHNRQDFVEVIPSRVQSVLQEAIYRVQHSYALAAFATLKVSHT